LLLDELLLLLQLLLLLLLLLLLIGQLLGLQLSLSLLAEIHLINRGCRCIELLRLLLRLRSRLGCPRERIVGRRSVEGHPVERREEDE
ncbi:hypothetical protein PMAYCL1PPCAC_12637, partial [Pristionchus mayeri]